MTLRMGDGPPQNIPPGLDAVAGYVNKSGIGITYPQVVAMFPNAHHLSITTNGSPAMCADVEPGAMSNWTGYDYGYCSVSDVNSLISCWGRPKKLWTAHYGFGAHICSPACWPGLVTTADGTQWIDHGGWDESLLADDFFDTVSPAPEPEDDMQVAIYAVNSTGGAFVLPAGCESKTGVPGPAGAPLRNSGLYVIMDGQQGRPQLPDSFLDAIPNA